MFRRDFARPWDTSATRLFAASDLKGRTAQTARVALDGAILVNAKRERRGAGLLLTEDMQDGRTVARYAHLTNDPVRKMSEDVAAAIFAAPMPRPSDSEMQTLWCGGSNC